MADETAAPVDDSVDDALKPLWKRPGWKLERHIQRTLGDGSNPGFNDFAYDSHLELKEDQNAELTLILRVFFQRVDPTPKGGGQKEIDYPFTNEKVKLLEITDQEFLRFRHYAEDVANYWWRGLSLVTPNEFDAFDWPRENPTVRPNVNCRLLFKYVEDASLADATVRLVAPDWGWFRSLFSGGFRSWVSMIDSTWNIRDNGWNKQLPPQDTSDLVWQRTVVHEVGHLLGLPHIGNTMMVKDCLLLTDKCTKKEVEKSDYGKREDLPVWLARDIMGIGHVIHACNLGPWALAMEQHTNLPRTKFDWIFAGVEIPPRRIKDIPRTNYTPKNSPYAGGYQERQRY
jgi:hypothetical protein